jgi:antirestriction protein ArdC
MISLANVHEAAATLPPRVLFHCHKPRHGDSRDPLIEEFLAAIGATIREEGNRASFIWSTDTIVMPPFVSFDSASAYYGTVFHELGHWTGHPSRLDRDLAKRFGKVVYAAEELIAHPASAFLCAEFSIDNDTGPSAYIGHYITLLENDDKAFFTRASGGQAAVDYLRDLVLRKSPQAAAE